MTLYIIKNITSTNKRTEENIKHGRTSILLINYLIIIGNKSKMYNIRGEKHC